MAGVFFAKAQGFASPQEKPGLVHAGLEASTAGDAADALRAILQPGDVVLVKGSRSVGLEAVAAKLQAE